MSNPSDRSARWARVMASLVGLLAVVAFVFTQYWSLDVADPQYGRMWGQILATAIGYAVYLAVMTIAFFLRPRVLRKR